jgi:predicted GNAT family acetyltransferase
MDVVEEEASPRGRLAVHQDGATAELVVYRTEPGRLILVHTDVPEALAGRGVGSRLVRAALSRAAADQLTVVPWCPFARQWLERHPDIAATVTIDGTPPVSPSVAAPKG